MRDFYLVFRSKFLNRIFIILFHPLLWKRREKTKPISSLRGAYIWIDTIVHNYCPPPWTIDAIIPNHPLSHCNAIKIHTQKLFHIFSFADKLIISDPVEFHDRTFMAHLNQLPWKEPLFTRRVEQTIVMGKHMTFCRVSNESVSVVSN